MTSSQAFMGAPNSARYASAKGAILGLTHALSAEGRTHGIGVNAIWPQAWTPMAVHMASGAEPVADENKGPMDLMKDPFVGSPTWVAAVVGWLCHESCESTGEIYFAGHGLVAPVVIAQGPGYYDENMSIESIRDHVNQVRGHSPLTVLTSTSQAVETAMAAAPMVAHPVS